MTMDDVLAGSIRKAVGSGEYQKALLLWNTYAARLQEELRQGACSRTRLAEARELVEWSRRVVLCARTHAQDQLNSLYAAAEYDFPVPSQASRIIQASF